MQKEYMPLDPTGKFFHVIEETGEVLKITGKIGRFGFHSRHPVDGGPTNAEMLLDEIRDLRKAIDIYEPCLIEEIENDNHSRRAGRVG